MKTITKVYKWIIPLSELNPEKTSYQNDFPQITTTIPNGLLKLVLSKLN
jgi:hypothetical protein